MTKDEVLARLCALTTRVGEHLKHVHATDCFCGFPKHTAFVNDFRFDEKPLEIVEAAVLEALGQTWAPEHKPAVSGEGACDPECKARPPHVVKPSFAPPGTVRVRIAVAVGGRERLPIWTAVGGDRESADKSGRRARRVNGTIAQHVVFVEADVPLPREAETVKGRVTE